MFESKTIIIVFLAYFLILLLLSFIKTKKFSYRGLMLFRVLFPSWRFYDDVNYVPFLYYRFGHDEKNFGEWKLVLPKLKRNIFNILINPEANLTHAYNTLIQQLEQDKEEVSEENKNDFVKSVSYNLIKNLVQKQIFFSHQLKSKFYFQFKIRAALPENMADAEDVLISITHEANAN